MHGREERAAGPFVDRGPWRALAVLLFAVLVGRSPALSGELTGRVIWSGERTLDDVWIRLVPESQRDPVVTEVFDAPDGGFRLESLPGGTYTLLARAHFTEGALIGRLDGVVVREPETRVEVPVFQGLDLAGRVLDVDGAPLAHTTVALGNSGPAFRLESMTDEDGRFGFAGLEHGAWRINTFDRFERHGLACVMLTADTEPLVLRQRPIEQLEGTVRIDGRAREGVTVALAGPPAGLKDGPHTTTDGAGNFRLDGLAKLGRAGGVPLVVRQGELYYGFRIAVYHGCPLELDLRSELLEVTIEDEEGRPLPSFEVSLSSGRRGMDFGRRTASTDDGGRLSVRVPAGGLVLEGRSAAYALPHTELPGDGRADRVLEAFSVESVRVRLLGPEGEPWRFATSFYLHDWTEEGWSRSFHVRRLTPDDRGEVTLEGAARRGRPALLKIKTWHPVVGPLRLEPGPARNETLVVQLQLPGSLSIRGPRQGIIYVDLADDEGESGLRFSDAGRLGEEPLEFSGLVPGTWIVRHDGDPPETSYSVVVRSGRLTEFSFPDEE